MKNRWKRLAAILGVAMLVVCQNGVMEVRAEEEAPVAQEASNAAETPVEKARSAELKGATDLKWETEKKGLASFVVPNEKGTASYKVTLWRDGSRLYTEENGYGDKELGDKVELFFFHSMQESGNYKFDVTTLDTNGTPKAQVFSDELTYEVATEQLPAPQNVSWSEDGIFSCERPNNDNFMQYVFGVYDSNGRPVVVSFGSPYVKSVLGDDAVTDNEEGITFNLNEYLKKKDVTPSAGYFVKVQATSEDASICRDSEFVATMFAGGNVEVAASDSSSPSTGSSTEEVVEIEEWKPVTPDEIKRYAAYSKEKVDFTAAEGNTYAVTIQNAMQGKLCYASFEAALGDYSVGRTYNIFPSDKKVYKMDSKARVTLSIPKALQADGREFKMICVTENGLPIVLKDLDANAETITFETDTYYAFALIYKD